jgi:serine/threonine protein kinase
MNMNDSPTQTSESELIDGHYRLDTLLGQGTMGVVFRACDVRLDRTVAIKLVDQRRSVDGAARRFEREARTLAQIRHENVVQIFALGEHEARQYIVMEHVDGRSLDTMIDAQATRGTTVPLDDAFGIIRRVGAGLVAVHKRGLVHRDVKPSNIMIEARTGRPVLIDFGLARRVDELHAKGSLAGGTPCYMAPEQARDPAAAGPWSDIYALACTAFELLTGSCVFSCGDLIEMLVAHAEKPPPRISSLRAELEPFDSLFARALAKMPGDRHQTCQLFLDELDIAACEVQANRSWTRSQTRTRTREWAIRGDGPLPSPHGLNVVLLQRPDGLRRNVVRLLTSTLGAGDEVAVACVDSEWDLLESFKRGVADVVVIDDDRTSGRTEHLVETMRRMPDGSTAEVIILARDVSSTWSRVGRLDAIGVPKPVSMQVLRSVVARIGRRIVERRSSQHAKSLLDTAIPEPASRVGFAAREAVTQLDLRNESLRCVASHSDSKH